MSTTPLKNQSNLIQSPTVRPTLEQMRAKLATSLPAPAGAVPSKPHRAKKPTSQIWLGMLIICGLMGSANFLFFIKKETLMDKLGLQRVLEPLKPPSNLAQADLVRFWAYATYDPVQLQVRFHTPAETFIDTENAKHHLTGLLKNINDDRLRIEIQALVKTKGQNTHK
jgi:hypothetical protein